MSHNLTDDEKKLLKEIVGAIRAKNLKEEFIVIFGPNGASVSYRENEGWLPFPDITKSRLHALEKEAMIRFRMTSAADGDNVVYVAVSQKGYEAVDRKFREKSKTNWAMVSALIALAVFCATVLWKLAEVAGR